MYRTIIDKTDDMFFIAGDIDREENAYLLQLEKEFNTAVPVHRETENHERRLDRKMKKKRR